VPSTYTQLASDFSDIHEPSLECECGLSRDDEEVANARQRRRDLFNYAIRKVLVCPRLSNGMIATEGVPAWLDASFANSGALASAPFTLPCSSLAADMTGAQIKDYLSGKTAYIETAAASGSGSAGQSIIYWASDGTALTRRRRQNG
jgi:hypothetical protein